MPAKCCGKQVLFRPTLSPRRAEISMSFVCAMSVEQKRVFPSPRLLMQFLTCWFHCFGVAISHHTFFSGPQKSGPESPRCVTARRAFLSGVQRSFLPKDQCGLPDARGLVSPLQGTGRDNSAATARCELAWSLVGQRTVRLLSM